MSSGIRIIPKTRKPVKGPKASVDEDIRLVRCVTLSVPICDFVFTSAVTVTYI